MARGKFKVETLTEKSVGTGSLKQIVAQLIPVTISDPADETTVCNPPNGNVDAAGSILVVITNPATEYFIVGHEYYIDFTAVV